MSGEETKAAMRLGPHSGEFIRIAVTSTAGTTALHAAMPGQYVQVRCLSGDCRVLLGGSTVTVDATQDSGASHGYPLAAGDKEDWLIKQTDTHIAHDSTTTAVIEIWLNSGKAL